MYNQHEIMTGIMYTHMEELLLHTECTVVSRSQFHNTGLKLPNTGICYQLSAVLLTQISWVMSDFKNFHNTNIYMWMISSKACLH